MAFLKHLAQGREGERHCGDTDETGLWDISVQRLMTNHSLSSGDLQIGCFSPLTLPLSVVFASLPPYLTSLSLSPSCAADPSSVDVLFDRGMVGVLVDKCLKEYVHNVALSEACLRTLVALAGAQRARRRLLHMGTVFRVTTALQVDNGEVLLERHLAVRDIVYIHTFCSIYSIRVCDCVTVVL
jgi:hypothetical protein